MKLVKPSFEILDVVDGAEILSKLEFAGRTCYKSESKITPMSAVAFVRNIIKSGHESVIEHEKITVKIVCDRGVTHEIVRHRIASYSQESTRYCNYGGGVTFIIPHWTRFIPGVWGEIWHGNHIYYGEPELEWGDLTQAERCWFQSMFRAEEAYINLIGEGWTPQQARSVLPNSLKTEIVMTCNLREWRHFFELRTSKAAHPQMREIAIPMLERFKELIPAVFEDISEG